MIVPSKFTSLDQSILGKLSHLIVDDVDEIPITELLELRLKKFSDIGEFIMALDTLFVLGRIVIDEKRGVLKYVG
jgi:predicted rRNA methylase YqxC with S4 and FtsJ domains